MSRAKRHVVECVWHSFSGRLIPCHRRVLRHKYEIEALSKITAVGFTDNTSMSVSVRPAKPREKVTEIWGYHKLLDECVSQRKSGFVHVNDLSQK